MTEGRAIALVALHDCKLLPSRSDSLIIVTERINQKYQCPVECLPEIAEEDFIKVITGQGKGMKALPGVYSDYRHYR